MDENYQLDNKCRFEQLVNKNKYVENYSIKIRKVYSMQEKDTVSHLVEDITWNTASMDEKIELFVSTSDQREQIQLSEDCFGKRDFWEYLLYQQEDKQCQFLDELLYLVKNNKQAQKLIASCCIAHILSMLGTCYDDNVRQFAYKIALLLLDPQGRDFENKQKISQLQKEVYESLYTFEKYYHSIEALTYKSVIVPLDRVQAELLTQGQIKDNDLRISLQEAITLVGGTAFFKLRRSPKDAFVASTSNTCHDSPKDILSSQPQSEVLSSNPSQIHSIKELLDLCKASQRIREDVFDFTEDVHPLVIREWKDPGNEFRCFFCNSNLNAVSCNSDNNYNQVTQSELEKCFNNGSFQDIFRKIPYTHAVLDVTIDNALNCSIIEINPFGKVASAGKFSWILDRDVLVKGYSKLGSVTIRW